MKLCRRRAFACLQGLQESVEGAEPRIFIAHVSRTGARLEDVR
jgi:hypothetical protein